jgi:hypothetical protein
MIIRTILSWLCPMDMLCCSIMKNDAPDMTAANTAAASQAAMSAEQLAWAKEIFAEQAPDREFASQTARDVSGRMLTGMDQQNQVTGDYIDDRNSLYRPLESGIVADANTYDTPERRAAAMQTAGADAERVIAQQREATARMLESQGVNPASGKNLAMSGMLDIGAAKVKAGAQNVASRGIETMGRAMKMDAAQLGRGNASAQATSAGIAMNQGNSATSAGMQPLAANAASNGIMQTGFGGAMNGLNSAGNLYTGIARAGQTDDSGMWGAVGTLGGAAIVAY